MTWFGILFASIGAAAILFALAFVSALIGVLVNGMILLTGGKPVDDFLRKRGEPDLFVPGSLK